MNDEQRAALVDELAAAIVDEGTMLAHGYAKNDPEVIVTARACLPVIERMLAAADARDVFAASSSDSWPPPTMKDAPFIRYLHKVMKPHQPTITPEECWVAIGAFRMWSSRNPKAALTAAGVTGAGQEGGEGE